MRISGQEENITSEARGQGRNKTRGQEQRTREQRKNRTNTRKQGDKITTYYNKNK